MSDTSRLLDRLADLLEQAAGELRRHSSRDPGVPATPEQDGSEPRDPDHVAQRAMLLHPDLGQRQEKVLRHLANVHPDGDTARNVHLAIEDGSEVSLQSTHQALARLVDLRLIRRDERSRAYRYYLDSRLLD